MNLMESLISKRKEGLIPVIAEVKRRIPRIEKQFGRGRDERDAGVLASQYEEGGAAAISLVTETVHFGGKPLEDIPAILESTSLPLLIKDFIVDPDKVDFYATLVEKLNPDFLGKVTLLVISHLVGEERLPSLLRYIYERGMLPLIETRGLQDLRYLDCLDHRPEVVGINNKDIDDLEMGDDVIRVDAEMISCYRKVLGESIIVSESAHRSVDDVHRSIEAGADAVLVGTAFLLADDPVCAVRMFVQAGSFRSAPDVSDLPGSDLPGSARIFVGTGSRGQSR
ncbi:MAG TPA: hypothetical protein GX507_03370 [Clostridia bacterium]|nr:hypothetical protein [Clostridia bacterium]